MVKFFTVQAAILGPLQCLGKHSTVSISPSNCRLVWRSSACSCSGVSSLGSSNDPSIELRCSWNSSECPRSLGYPPSKFESIYVYLPKVDESYSAPFFAEYTQSLAFSGLDVTQVDRPEEIPVGAAVLLPWLTDPLPLGDEFDQGIGRLAGERRWTVFLFGEHTNLGGVADRIERITGFRYLRDDLSVPPGNRDLSGPLLSLGVTAWPASATLNRGATVTIRSERDRVLLAGDGWFADKDLKEWLWVGDYLWQPGERSGRIPLALWSESGGARWVIVADNSMAINEQVVADPRPMISLISLGGLMPTFYRDLAIVLIIIGCLVQEKKYIFPIIVTGALIATVGETVHARSPSKSWRDFYRDESTFFPRNFNKSVAREASFFTRHDLSFYRKEFIHPETLQNGRLVIVFGLIDETLSTSGIEVKDCKRLGGVKTSEGPMIMDGQACRVDGKVDILLGTRTSAAAIGFEQKDGYTILVFDKQFLAQHSPRENMAWLIDLIEGGSRN